MNYSRKFERKVFHGTDSNLSVKSSDDGTSVLVSSVNPYLGLDPEAFKPVNVLKAGGTLKPSPKLSQESCDYVDTVSSQIVDVQSKNNDALEQASYAEMLRKQITETSVDNE